MVRRFYVIKWMYCKQKGGGGRTGGYNEEMDFWRILLFILARVFAAKAQNRNTIFNDAATNKCRVTMPIRLHEKGKVNYVFSAGGKFKSTSHQKGGKLICTGNYCRS